MPEGDTMLVIWLKLLTLAGKKNDNGLVYLTNSIPYTPEILSDIFNRESRLISLALNTFSAFGMIEIENDIISVLNWDKHQNIEGMDKIREQNRIRQNKYRERKQLSDSNVTLRYSNGTDKNRIDKEENKNKNKNKNSRFTPDLSFIENADWRRLYQEWVDNNKSPFKKQIGVEKGFAELTNLSKNDLNLAQKIIDKSLANNWSGLFELKEKQTYQQPKPESNFNKGMIIIPGEDD